MKIGFDARFITKQKRGIGKYSFNLLSNLLRIDNKNKYILYLEKSSDRSCLPANGELELRNIGNGHSTLWEQYFLPQQIKRDKLDLFHSPGNIPPILCKTKRVVTLHDTIMFQPEMSRGSGWYDFYLRKALSYSIGRVNRIITISNNSKKDIIKLFPRVEQKVEVIYEGVEERFEPLRDEGKMEPILKRYGVNKPFILHFGSNDPRKNTLKVIKVYHRLAKEQNIPHQLVLLGFRQEKKTPIDFYLKKNDLTERVISISFLSENDLPNFYQGANFLLYPSLYEGFGFPPLEAMACGTPVIVSNVSSIPEIVGEAAILVNPIDESEMYKACTEVLDNRNKRRELIRKGFKRVKDFSWEKTASLTLEVYEEVGRE